MADKSLLADVRASRAQAKHVRVTPMKARRLVDVIRGMQAEEALAVLKFAPQSASEPVYKVVASAVANARHLAERDSRRLDVEDLVIAEAYVDEGPTLKRFRPRAQGRAFRVRKRTSHITVVVAPRPEDEQKSTSSPRNDSIRTLGRFLVTSRRISMRSSMENSPCFVWFTSTATITSSNRRDDRSMMSRCPRVTGSKDPGQTARLTSCSPFR